MDTNFMNVFVKAELLLHEETYEALRKFLSNLSTTEDISFSSIDFIDGKIVISAADSIYNWVRLNLIGQRLSCGYILIQIEILKKMVNLIS